jgi:hypothetical protein
MKFPQNRNRVARLHNEDSADGVRGLCWEGDHLLPIHIRLQGQSICFYSSITTYELNVLTILQSFVGRGHPAIWFRYDISPLTVKYREKGEAFFSFLTAICAVVGGVFTVANMIDGLLFSASEYYKKLEIGKVS